MSDNYIITISRQYGSCGRAVGREVAKRLGIDFYDKELITRAAKESGISEKVFESMDERPTNSLLYSLAVGAYALDSQYLPWADASVPLADRVYIAQSDLIKKLAAEKSCVFIGRCADYILKDFPNVINVFVTDTDEARTSRIMLDCNLSENKARDLISKTDKKRANYYSFHTNRTWNKCDNYDLSVRTSNLGIEGTADLIVSFAECRLGRKLRTE